MSRRNQRINYRVLNSTGNIVPLSDEILSRQLGNLSLQDSSSQQSIQDSSSQQSVQDLSSEQSIQDLSTQQSIQDSSITQLDVSPTQDSPCVKSEIMEGADTPNAANDDDLIDIMVMSQDIMDIIDENPAHCMESDDINAVIQKLEILRSQIRKKEFRLKSTDQVISTSTRTSIDHAVMSVKDFIKSANDMKVKSKLLKEDVRSLEIAQRERTTAFLLSCTNRSLKDLEALFNRNLETAHSDDLLKWRDQLPGTSSMFDKITDNVKECLASTTTDPSILSDIKATGDKYAQVDKMKQKFTTNLSFEISQRELDKHSRFAKSKLNIKIEKFSGTSIRPSPIYLQHYI